MARSQETFNKKQREKKRLEKKKSKLEKRENRKNNEITSKSLHNDKKLNRFDVISTFSDISLT